VGASPIRQSLQPEAIGAVILVTEARAGLESSNADADPPVIWGRPLVWGSNRHAHPRDLEDQRLDELEQIARDVWDNLPDENRTWLKSYGAINVGVIVAVDELGDDLFQGVHIYVPFSPTDGPFYGFMRRLDLSPFSKRYDVPRFFDTDPAKRIDRFPAQTKKAKQA
jgi:hypothetical protein